MRELCVISIINSVIPEVSIDGNYSIPINGKVFFYKESASCGNGLKRAPETTTISGVCFLSKWPAPHRSRK